MRPDVLYLSRESTTYADVEQLLADSLHLKAFPVVDNLRNRILIGSCSRARLLRSLESQISMEHRQQEANVRIKKAIESVEQRLLSPAGEGAATSSNDAEAPAPVKNIDRFKVQAIKGLPAVNMPDASNQLKPQPFMRRNGLSAGCLTMAEREEAKGYESEKGEGDSNTRASKLTSRLSVKQRSFTTLGAGSNDVYATIGGERKFQKGGCERRRARAV
jgi:hypothetical protein